ncbi:MAG: sigma-54 dependent transcriptional regulator [gamma proteobacterium symbiont of Bathyaustriella thionipta]|nr:sigma-54 dependent transcriptional regulator [gamma proteobacterium symbiont of Bathyaustriella thionipta]MCU7949261.1 sigma-54 dependent transcriptional regulator [gamma proteobacterium symbiont of Bathyaustriella thionipta]MCU7954401.1 sigma-54 dependent transcriptional regulator [gamma proteobacterium symbiont of Bathyaustriella thionipta]MCU7955878.1 sigma-54 dependent transcriptional regulator [gamma proteobacterium symbiont of Bathyaustriella thionipta]MCU7966078.1 sigma-54 dependent t
MNKELTNIFFIDDEYDLRLANQQTLELEGYNVELFEKAEDALSKIDIHWPGIIICDIRLPGMDGLSLLQEVQKLDSELPVILITGHGDISMAVGAMRIGAYDFIEKPFSTDRLLDSVRRALDKRRLTIENRHLKTELEVQDVLGPRIIGTSQIMQTLRNTIKKVSDTDADILLMGETGTGKELIARSLHKQSKRHDNKFVAINCGAIPENLIESELFGHEKGAFTGAETQRSGKFEYAKGGTIFLDEIESMPLVAQVRLLRILQEHSLERLGSNETIELDIRVIAASKVDLRDLADKGEFREDLYYRLNVVKLDIPPLRDRREDIPLLFKHFLLISSVRYGREVPIIQQNSNQRLMAFSWPGNIRELRNLAERYVLLGDECISKLDENTQKNPCTPMTLPEHVEVFERALIKEALADSGGIIKDTMSLLGLPRKTLYDKMQKFGLDKKVYK